jgi:hypothetical protein
MRAISKLISMLAPGPFLLAKHKVASSTLLTRSIFEPLIRQGLFLSLLAFKDLVYFVRNLRARLGFLPGSA